MKVEGSHTFHAPREVVWPMLLDAEVLRKILPGCEQLDLVSEGRYEGALKIKIGPVQGSFDGTITLTDLSEPKSADFSLTGEGAPGFVNATGHFRLDDEGDRSTVHYEGDAQIGGRLASVGQRLLDSSSRAVIRSGLEGLDAHIEASKRPVASTAGDRAAEGHEAPEQPSPVEFAAGVARHMVRDAMGDRDRQELVRKIVLAALALAVLYGFCRRVGRPRGGG